MVSEMLQVGDIGCDFCEIPDSCRTFRPQTVGFDKYSCLFKPGEKVIVRALEFDISEGAVAENVASDADIQLVLGEDASGRYGEKFLKFGLAGW